MKPTPYEARERLLITTASALIAIMRKSGDWPSTLPALEDCLRDVTPPGSHELASDAPAMGALDTMTREELLEELNCARDVLGRIAELIGWAPPSETSLLEAMEAFAKSGGTTAKLNVEALNRLDKYEHALHWALGEGDSDFGDHEPPATKATQLPPPRYWWRTELRRRAFGADS